MTGASYHKPRLFNSFETIPLVLIDNAIKYFLPSRDVIVRVDDERNGDGCFVSVESHGPIIPTQYRDQVFARSFRTPLAKETVSSGSGLGLYIANIVAKSHDFVIRYDAYPEQGRSQEGANVFSFVVKSRP